MAGKFRSTWVITTLLLLGIFQSSFAQTTVQLGTGNIVPTNTLYSPVYRYSASSTTTACRSNILYRPAELAAAGITSGSTITAIAFNKTNNANFLIPATYKVYMGNTSNTTLPTTTTWASILSSHTEVYSSTSFNVPNTAGWFTITLATPFVYTGGSLEIAADLVMTGGSTGATDKFLWECSTVADAVANDNIVGSTTTNATTLNGTVADYKRRPNIKISFTGSAPCTAPPTPGTVTAASVFVCAGSPVQLTLTGQSVGSGQTYQWQSSPDSSAWANIAGAEQTIATVNPTVTTFYRCAVTCSGSTANTPGVKITVPSAVSGTFTINKALPTGGTNFARFGDAINYIKCGINGPVVLDVVPLSGPYNEQVKIPAIGGASSVNTITINGNGNTLAFNSALTGERAGITLDGADHITIDSLIIDATAGTYGWGIHFTNGADSNTVRKCTINSSLSSTTSTNHAPIVMSGSFTSAATAGNSGNYNTITGNRFSGGYHGVVLYGSGSPNFNIGNKVTGNTILDAYANSIQLYGQREAMVTDNVVSRPNRISSTTAYGVNISNSIGSNIERNRIHSMFESVAASTSAFYGVYFTASDAPPAYPNRVVNNLIYNINSNGIIYGIYNTGSDTMHAYHNTLVFDDAGTTTAAVYGFYQTTEAKGLEFRNNIVYITRGGTGIKRAIYLVTTTSTVISNNNVLYLNAAAGTDNRVGQYGTTSFATLNDWKTANSSAYDQASVDVDPLFVNANPGDYLPTNAIINNLGANVGVATDVNGTPRSATPDPGAVEFTLDGCTNPPTAGLAKVSDTNPCKGATFSLSLDGNSIGAGQMYQWQSSPDNGTWTNLGSASSSPVYSTSIDATTYFRCIVTCNAGTPVNSTTVLATVSSFSGNYTINKLLPTAGTNFASFADAVNALRCGIEGPVVFTVAPFSGPYNERVVINDVPGTSAINTITFFGNGNTINYAPAGTNDRTAFLLNGSDHIILDSLTIDVSAGASYGWGIQLTAKADSNIIRKCTIITSISSTSTNYSGIVVSSSATSSTSTGDNGNDNLFENNTVNGGYYGIVVTGSTTTYNLRNVVRGNKLLDQYSAPINFNGQKSGTVSGNDISRPARTNSTTLYGIYIESSSDGLLVEKNRVHNMFDAITTSHTAYALYIASSNGLADQPNRMENNVVYNMNSAAGTQGGIYHSSGDHWQIAHNTIILDHLTATGTTTITYGIYTNGGGSTNVRNNIAYVTRSGSANKFGLWFGTTWNGQSNNNVIYVNAGEGTNITAYKGVNYLTLADWKASNSNAYDQNSFSVDPLFVSSVPGDFVPSEVSINNIGANVGVATDILGITRGASPDPGAFEFTASGCSNPPTPGTVVAPPNVCALTLFPLDLTGNSVGEGLTFQWQVSADGNTWTNLGSAASAAAYTTSQNQTSYYRCQVKCGSGTAVPTPGVMVSSPPLIPASTFTINSAVVTGSGNFQTFGDAVNHIKCGISGPVVFNVVANSGPYNEQVIIPKIPGTSHANTVTFNGNGNTVLFNVSDANERSVIALKTADHIILDSLTIDAGQGTYGWGIGLVGQSDSNIVRKCTITGNTTATSSNYMGIVIAGSAGTYTTTGNNGNYNLFEKNTIVGGYHGMSIYGNTPGAVQFNIIRDNMFKDFYYSGTYVSGVANTLISNNDYSRPARTNASLYTIYVTTNNGGILVEKNRIHNVQDNVTSKTTFYGIYLNANGVSGNINKVENNLVYNISNAASTQYGIYGLSRTYWNISHNTIALDDQSSTSGTSYGIYLYGTTELNINNNIVSATRAGTGSKYCLYFSTTGVTSSNNNVLYVQPGTATTYGVGYFSTAFQTLAQWKTANGGVWDQNSLSTNPLFVDAAGGNLLPGEASIAEAGNGTTGVLTDILGNSRSATKPTPGAYEMSGSLPVTFATLAARRVNDVNLLDWATFTEINNKGFEVERSFNGINFSKIGFVDSKVPGGNSNSLTTYDFVDVSTPATDCYYRLKQVDKDGRKAHSKVVKVHAEKAKRFTIAAVYPNPVTGSLLNVVLNSPASSKIAITVSDVHGKAVRQYDFAARAGSNSYQLNTANLAKGTYILKVSSASSGFAETALFVVQ